MELDDELCLCFHVTKRKVVNFLRIEKPRKVGQLSECFGAGTGCGWCRTYLQQLFDEAKANASQHDASNKEMPNKDTPRENIELKIELKSDEYAKARASYIREGKGTPPSSG